MPPDGVVVFLPRMRMSQSEHRSEEKWDSRVFVDACRVLQDITGIETAALLGSAKCGFIRPL